MTIRSNIPVMPKHDLDESINGRLTKSDGSVMETISVND